MLSYLEKYNNLPPEIKEKVSTPEIMDRITELESKYNVSLATVIMRVMVKEISLLDLAKFFVFENSMEGKKAEELVEELKSKVFIGAANYLGFGYFQAPKMEADGEFSAHEEGDKEKEKENIGSSTFFFSPEDEEEVRQLAKKVEDFKTPEEQAKPQKHILTLDEKVAKAIKVVDEPFSSGDLRSRFENLVKTYIKGVRSRIDAKQTLIKSISAGGFELEPERADVILGLIEGIKNQEYEEGQDKKLESAPSLKMEVDDDILATSPVATIKDIPQAERDNEAKENADILGERDVGYDFSKLGKPVANNKKEADVSFEKSIGGGIVNENKKIEVKAQENKKGEEKQMDGEEKQMAAKIVSEEIEKEGKLESGQEKKEQDSILNIFHKEKPAKKEAEKEKNAGHGLAHIRQRANIKAESAPSGKVKMEDVKFVPKIMGPIDELREMDLENFRRLSQDPFSASSKIKEKISFLEEEGYAEKLSGIKSWRQSPVVKIYLDIGQESIKTHAGIETVISKRQQEGRETLTQEEFKAVMDLNKSIRY